MLISHRDKAIVGRQIAAAPSQFLMTIFVTMTRSKKGLGINNTCIRVLKITKEQNLAKSGEPDSD
jgi:hypothetical protein